MLFTSRTSRSSQFQGIRFYEVMPEFGLRFLMAEKKIVDFKRWNFSEWFLQNPRIWIDWNSRNPKFNLVAGRRWADKRKKKGITKRKTKWRSYLICVVGGGGSFSLASERFSGEEENSSSGRIKDGDRVDPRFQRAFKWKFRSVSRLANSGWTNLYRFEFGSGLNLSNLSRVTFGLTWIRLDSFVSLSLTSQISSLWGCLFYMLCAVWIMCYLTLLRLVFVFEMWCCFW